LGYVGEKKREYQRAWLLARRNRGVALLGSCCADCGSFDNLEFDHIDPETKDSRLKGSDRGTGSLWSWSWERIEIELAKCQLLCTACHKKKSSIGKRTRVCPQGHDKDIVGRDYRGKCKECNRLRMRIYRSK
jgi:5-methylcytosine-specific restriction endonuclease McrA